MIVIGLTGSIGMGKSTTAELFAEAGLPVHSADAAVHALYRGAAAPAIEAAFPGSVRDGVVDRDRLAARVLGDAAALKRLEAIVHPLVREAERAFLKEAEANGAPAAVLATSPATSTAPLAGACLAGLARRGGVRPNVLFPASGNMARPDWHRSRPARSGGGTRKVSFATW